METAEIVRLADSLCLTLIAFGAISLAVLYGLIVIDNWITDVRKNGVEKERYE